MAYATSDDSLISICDEFERLPTNGAEGDANLADFMQTFKSEFQSQRRNLSDATQYCIARYVEAELDSATLGNRGLGRMSDHIPRFAAKHRRIFSSLSESTLDEFRFALSRHIICGRLFIEINYHLEAVDESKLSNDNLFERWLPRVYMPPEEVLTCERKEPELTALWFAAAGKPFHDLCIQNGIKWDGRDAVGTDQVILTHYFTAGTTLRYTEAELSVS